MKKIVSLLLAGLMLMLCAAGLAENVVTTQFTSGSDKFDVSFTLPEGAQVLKGQWMEGNLYQANIQLKKGEYLYMAVDGSAAGTEEGTVTYNEQNGYTDEKLLGMIDSLYGDEYDNYDKQIVTTTYGTKICVIRANDEESPMAYAWSVWHGFEIGFTLLNVGEDGKYLPITDEQIQNMTAFAGEVWMHMNITEGEQAPEAAAEATPEEQELAAVSEWLGTFVSKDNPQEVLDWDLETIKSKLEGYEGELKYNTKDQIAEKIYQQLAMMKGFMSAMENMTEEELASQIYMIEPIFDSTHWTADGCAEEIVCQSGKYLVTVAQTLEAITNDTDTRSFLCELTDNRTLTGEGNTFTAVDEDNKDVLIWKNAEGQEVKFSQYNTNYVGRFENSEYKMVISCQNASYEMKLGKSWEAIENGAEDVLTYTCRQESMSSNLTGNYDENSQQADKGYCYFNYDEFTHKYDFNNGGDLEMAFTRAAE